jgi:hypothetical protein
LHGFVAATNVPKKSAVKAKLKQLENAVKQHSQLRELLSRPVHLPMLVTVLPTLDGYTESLNRPILYEHFIHRIITREMTRLLPAVREKYSREERFTFASSLALMMLNSGELMMIRYSEIPTNVVAPFVRRGETVDIAKRDLVTNCFLERKPPDLFTFGHKSFGEFLAARKLLDLVRAESSLDAEVKRSSIEVWEFVNEIATQDDLDRIFEHPDPHVNSITLMLGVEALKKPSGFLREYPALTAAEATGRSPILDRAFSGQNIRVVLLDDSLHDESEFYKRLNILERMLHISDKMTSVFASDPRSAGSGLEFSTQHELIELGRDYGNVTNQIRSWYSR